jgi:hypothetical protein
VTEPLPEPETTGVLLDALLAERQVRLESLDAMGNKAGVMLGFTGALVALTPLIEPWWLRFLVLLPAALAVRHSLAALKVVLAPGLGAAGMREELLMRRPREAQLTIYDYFTIRHRDFVETLTSKADSVDAAARWLAITIAMLALACILDGVL